MKKPAHRPKRTYSDALIHRSHVTIKTCPFCDSRLVTTSSREVDKYVQTLDGHVHVIGYSRRCSNKSCPHPEACYHAPQAAKLSLPNVTYGLDILCYIENRHSEDKKNFKEIWQELSQEKGIEISEREVGRLYRKMAALLVGNQVMIQEKLAKTVEKYGQLIMEVDGLQPDGNGPKLYVLHELLSGTVLSIVQLDQANTVTLTAWLEPYREWGKAVKATLSDKEKALVAALKAVWPEAKHQLCQMHFVKNLSEPVHKADRELQTKIREAMGKLPPVPTPVQKRGEKSSSPSDNDDDPDSGLPARVSPAVIQAIDIVSGVSVKTLDSVAVDKWESLLGDNVEPYPDPEVVVEDASATEVVSSDERTEKTTAPSTLSASESITWLNEKLWAQIPASARPLVEDTPDSASITYWEHTRYRQAIQDARHSNSRKPFLCGGVRSYEQLRAIDEHLTACQRERELDPYLSLLHNSVQRVVVQTASLASNIEQAKQWVVQVERFLADAPQADGSQLQLPSSVQRQRMHDLLMECEKSSEHNPVLQDLHINWKSMLERWEDDLYHCYDIEKLPRSNLGLEALFGDARRQQRRLNGQADTSHLAITGQVSLRANSAGQDALLEIVSQVPVWIYRTASRCLGAVETGIRWPRLLHRNAIEALEKFKSQADELRKQAASALAIT
jgi:MULE transposase-like protein